MKTSSLKCIALLACLVLASCQPLISSQSVCQQREQSNSEVEVVATAVELLEPRTNGGRHRQKVDNLIILVDDSIQLLQCQGQLSTRQRAFGLIDRINSSLVGIQLNKAIRIFGPHADRNKFDTTTVYGMAGSQTSTLKPSIITMTPDRPMMNPLAMALESVYHELKDVKGNTAILLLSDFENLDSEVYSTIEMVNQYYTDRICLYGVYLGDDKKHANFLNKILGVDTCGFFGKESALTEPDLLADFLEKTIFEIMPVVDVTKDLTRTHLKEIETKKVETVVKEMEKIEPVVIQKPVLTYEKLEVEKEIRIVLKTEFDFGTFVIKPLYAGHLGAIADFMKKYSDTTTVIEGHTCNLGPNKYNMRLSQQRADAVKNYLVNKLSVNIKRISTKAYGETHPKADNSTKEGRIQNRRAEAVITAIVTEMVNSNDGSLESSLDSAHQSADRFVEIDENSVLDNETGLMWGRYDNGKDIGWLDAEKYCDKYSGGGFSDWRMATQKELQTLYLAGKKNNDGFYITESISLTDCCPWASDVSMNSAGIFSFKTGKRPWGYQSDTFKLRALPVRTAN